MAELVFLRHGHALSAREAGVSSDAERPLSPLGELEVRRSAERLRAGGFIPDVIISSPFLRADRTAMIAAGIFPAALRRTSVALSDGPAQAVLDLIKEAPGGSVMLVGHQPLLGAAAGFCLGAGPLDFSPGAFARVRLPGGEGKAALLELYAPPAPGEILR
jgi:phosphohistidine phosphatase